MMEDDGDTAAEAGEVEDELTSDLEVQIHRAVLQREQTPDSFPDGGALAAMEEPIHRLMDATVLFTDMTMFAVEDPPLSPMGLSFLAHAMKREALRLFRLYHGHRPRCL